MKIAEIIRHYLYIPYKPPVDPYWGWKAPCHGAHARYCGDENDEGVTGWEKLPAGKPWQGTKMPLK